jgi:hypothetical protein
MWAKNHVGSEGRLVEELPNRNSDFCPRNRELRRRHVSSLRAVVLLEVMLACAIVGLSLAGFAVALQKSLEASMVSRRESAMRMALQSRVAELQAEKVSEGEKKFTYSGDITVEQSVGLAEFRNEEDEALESVFRVRLKATQSNSTVLPVETEVLVYQP